MHAASIDDAGVGHPHAWSGMNGSKKILFSYFLKRFLMPYSCNARLKNAFDRTAWRSSQSHKSIIQSNN
jgi:hypothetical protein